MPNFRDLAQSAPQAINAATHGAFVHIEETQLR